MTCEICNKNKYAEKGLVLVAIGELEEFKLCEECIEKINAAESEQEEINFVKGGRYDVRNCNR